MRRRGENQGRWPIVVPGVVCRLGLQHLQSLVLNGPPSRSAVDRCRLTVPKLGAKGPQADRAVLARDFARDTKGVAAIEFAFLALPTLMTLLVIFSMGLNSLFTASLERAVVLTGRAITTGAVSPTSMQVSTLKTNVICPALLSIISCDDVFVNVKTLQSGSNPSTYYSLVKSDRSGLIKPALNSSQNSFCPGAGSQYVVVELAYPAPIIASSLIGSTTATYNGSSVNLIVATATFLSEPYTGAVSYSGC